MSHIGMQPITVPHTLRSVHLWHALNSLRSLSSKAHLPRHRMQPPRGPHCRGGSAAAQQRCRRLPARAHAPATPALAPGSPACGLWGPSCSRPAPPRRPCPHWRPPTARQIISDIRPIAPQPQATQQTLPSPESRSSKPSTSCRQAIHASMPPTT